MFECNVMVKSLPPRKMGHCGGMAERLKAHVLKTCLGHTNVGSNPTPSAERCRKPAACKLGAFQQNIGEVPEWSNGAAC